MAKTPGYRIKIDWTDNDGIARTAVCGVDIGMYPTALGALNAVKAIVQTMVTAKASIKGSGNPTNFATSVVSTIVAPTLQQ